MRKTMLGALAAAGLFALATNASASIACLPGDVSPAASACAGFYSGNLLNEAHNGDQITALDSLGYDTTGFDFNDKSFVLLTGLGGSQTLDFGKDLYGVTYIAVHYGNGKGSPGNPVGSHGSGDGEDTAFYKFDFKTAVDQITLNFDASSDAILYSTGVAPSGAVPEPATWGMMLLGFFGMGALLRGRRKQVAATA